MTGSCTAQTSKGVTALAEASQRIDIAPAGVGGEGVHSSAATDTAASATVLGRRDVVQRMAYNLRKAAKLSSYPV